MTGQIIYGSREKKFEQFFFYKLFFDYFPVERFLNSTTAFCNYGQGRRVLICFNVLRFSYLFGWHSIPTFDMLAQCITLCNYKILYWQCYLRRSMYSILVCSAYYNLL